MEKADMVNDERKNETCIPSPSDDCPWLFSRSCPHAKSQTFYSLSENKSYVCRVPELVGYDVWNSCHGWLIMFKEYQLSLWNPLTFETIHLPPIEFDDRLSIESCILSSPPSYPDSTIFLFDEENSNIWFCGLHNQKHRWFTYCYKEDVKAFEGTVNYLYRPVCCDNKVYALTFQDLMVLRFDIIEPHSLVLHPVIEAPFVEDHIGPRSNTFLLESLGELFTMFLSYDDKSNGRSELMDIYMYKLDLSSMVWNKVRNTKNQAFFFSEDEENSRSAICSEDVGNRIYFTRINDDSLYSYHISDANLSISLPKKCMEFSTWILPNTRLTNLCGEALGMTRKEQREKEQASIETEKKAEVRKEETSQISQNEEKESKATCLFDLPFDVLRHCIIDRLVLHDYMNFRLVSSKCREATPPFQLKTSGCPRLETQTEYTSPWLIFFQEHGRLFSFVNPQHVDRCQFFQVHESLHDSRIFYCKDGWLLMAKLVDNGNISINFFNPLTKDIIPYEDLSNVETNLFCARFVFSSAPTSSDCVVVVIFSTGFEVEIRICRSKAKGWVSFVRDCNIDFDPFITNPILVGEAFYFLGQNGSLGALKIQEEDCNWEVFATPENDHLSISESYLAERNGEVFLVLIGKIGEWVRVFMLEKSTMSWKLVEDLGNYSLYISRTSSLFTVAESPDTKNIIYFPRLCGEQMVSYSLSTKSFQSSKTGDLLSNYHGTMEPLICGWIKPSLS